MLGSRTNGFQPHGQVDEDVLGWERQYAEMYDSGIRVFSPIFFSTYIPGLAWGEPQTPAIPAQLQRQMDGQVMLAQKHHLIFAPCLFFLAKYMAMENMDFSRRICEELASVTPRCRESCSTSSMTVRRRLRSRLSRNGQSAAWKAFGWAANTSCWRKRMAWPCSVTAAKRFPCPPTATTLPGHPALYRARDMRAAGKSFHLSEFGVNSPGAKPSDVDSTPTRIKHSGSPPETIAFI